MIPLELNSEESLTKTDLLNEQKMDTNRIETKDMD